jgi:hypothetical protein
MSSNDQAHPDAGTLSESAHHHIQNARTALSAISQMMDCYSDAELRTVMKDALVLALRRMKAAADLLVPPGPQLARVEVEASAPVAPPLDVLDDYHRRQKAASDLLKDARVRAVLARPRSANQRGTDGA